ncbi:MAG: hypothetical protein IK014_12085 [Lachnospiraceae bacterium]|nr:hypothetical protein [Lachnospiraceae bacterium]
MKKWMNAEVIELDVAETSCHWWWIPVKPYIPCKPPVQVEVPPTTPDQPPVVEEPPVVDLKS